MNISKNIKCILDRACTDICMDRRLVTSRCILFYNYHIVMGTIIHKKTIFALTKEFIVYSNKTTIGFGDLTPTADFNALQNESNPNPNTNPVSIIKSSSFSVVYRIVCLLWERDYKLIC